MSFEFKKAFEKATEKRALTFNQQWAMSDMGIFNSESPVSMSLYNVPPGKKFSIRQLQGTYGPFLIKSTHYDVNQENCWNACRVTLYVQYFELKNATFPKRSRNLLSRS